MPGSMLEQYRPGGTLETQREPIFNKFDSKNNRWPNVDVGNIYLYLVSQILLEAGQLQIFQFCEIFNTG